MSVGAITDSEGNSLDVTEIQKTLTYISDYAYEPARTVFRNAEKLCHTMPQDTYWAEMATRVKGVAIAFFLAPFAATLWIPALAFHTAAACMGKGRFELRGPESPAPSLQGREIKIISINTCFQYPYSPCTGGVVSPFERVAHCASRIEALVNAVADENPDVLMGQEFESLSAQDESIRLLKEKGFQYFLRDFGSTDPIRNRSGLFVASKVRLENIQFVLFPTEDKAGLLSKMSGLGALAFTVKDGNGRDIRLVNTHLNYGGSENQWARSAQLTKHVMPLLQGHNAALFGDLNFDTASVPKKESGLAGFVNALEGQVTCTDEGKHILRGKSQTPDGKPCTDCEEKIDGLIYNPDQIQVTEWVSKPLRLHTQLLSDHYATIATLQLLE